MTVQKVIKWYYTNLKFNNWDLYVAVSDQGVTFIGSNHKGFSELEYWQQKKGTNILLVADQGGKTDKVITQLTEYLAGKRTTFTLPFDFIGTLFQQKVWREVAKIPYGTTTCYSDIAQKIGHPRAVRAVGTAIGNNSMTIIVPCHRVLGKNNALRGYRGGLEMKASLLQLENIW
ncbi:MAG: methylated-DNA--[protein]-cysteine S-methyltransferase [Spiroplasma poulsonii]|uniref:methylated-DNA--[protein]-cysteine S-methyltransferase n=1 Tax=Spiroplasma poulsonii TaxID=2138 RepID=A0A2P6FB13_9MOLU|nr:methylated-DNA--[protein]-cysteine S-methyltransferase [Spiroplasma poulsonii]KAF0851787.1 Methylated-DNA--protein-cysteine methyltransferase, inducible [Spiroplasma poulsonii]MBW1242093.1 methylated-DNA--[protein]-cysteine S-methyltransferase [Spiroplasma poulsonii]PQM30574.1 Methylated-DNA--protein-cysteine methyltransferase, inducible [Spiroplasma poulsonii]PWF95553.1 Methylated-DNA--protein-cysteine methyltransferase, inducible [Spiroplasma poulsonii]PWF98334.1 Methylated-DNA--protein-c